MSGLGLSTLFGLEESAADEAGTVEGHEEPEQSLRSALVHATAAEAELYRTHLALEQIDRERAQQGQECGSVWAQLDDVRAQLSEVVAIGAERRALRKDMVALEANIERLREQCRELARGMASLRQHWSTREVSSGPEQSRWQESHRDLTEPASSLTHDLALVAALG